METVIQNILQYIISNILFITKRENVFGKHIQKIRYIYRKSKKLTRIQFLPIKNADLDECNITIPCTDPGFTMTCKQAWLSEINATFKLLIYSCATRLRWKCQNNGNVSY